MLAATVYDLYQQWSVLEFSNGLVIAIGFAAAFVTAMLVVRAAIWFIGRHGFVPFAIYRIIVGGVMLAILLAR